MSKNRKQQLSRSLAKLVSIWLVNQINDFLWISFFCPFRLRNPAKNIATNPNIACTRGKWSLWWFEPCISKELKTLTGGILKQKKKRESEKKILCTYSGALLYSDETLILMRVVSSRLPVPWMICEHYVNHMLKISVSSDNAVWMD